MFELISEGSFPFKNIAFLLFSDVIQWFKCEDVRGMTYSKPVKLFWATGRRLFENRFTEFMRGPSFKGVDREDHGLNPANSKINFAVPSIPSLKFDLRNPSSVQPGLLEDMIDTYVELNPCALTVSHNLSGDLKKVNRSKKDTLGNGRFRWFYSGNTRGKDLL